MQNSPKVLVISLMVDNLEKAFELTRLRETDCGPGGDDCYTTEKQREVYASFLLMAQNTDQFIQDELNKNLEDAELNNAVSELEVINKELDESLMKQKGAVKTINVLIGAVALLERLISLAAPVAFGRLRAFSLQAEFKTFAVNSSALPILMGLAKAIGSNMDEINALSQGRTTIGPRVFLSRLNKLVIYLSLQIDEEPRIPDQVQEVAKTIIRDIALTGSNSRANQSLLEDLDYLIGLLESRIIVVDT
jgi:hypothetical protein